MIGTATEKSSNVVTPPCMRHPTGGRRAKFYETAPSTRRRPRTPTGNVSKQATASEPTARKTCSGMDWQHTATHTQSIRAHPYTAEEPRHQAP